MKKRSYKISKVLALEAAAERRFGAATGRSRQQLQEQLARLGELNAYRQSYASHSRSLDDVNSAHWKDYQSFLQRLDRAVQSQQQLVRDSEQDLEIHRRRWLAKRQRLDSLQRVLERYQADEKQFEERREQRVQDDLPSFDNPYAED